MVAIKVISLADTPPEDFRLIEKEIEFLASCNHPNIVHYIVSVKCFPCPEATPSPISLNVQIDMDGWVLYEQLS